VFDYVLGDSLALCNLKTSLVDSRMKKLAENDLTYFYLRHVVIVVTAVETISLPPVIMHLLFFPNLPKRSLDYRERGYLQARNQTLWSMVRPSIS
jgi:hypothetical protein